MSEHTQPHANGLHSIAPAAIASRLQPGHGAELAKVIWWIILSLPTDGPRWRNNADLGDDAGLPWSAPEQQAQRAVRRLRESGMVATTRGHRPDARRKWGRILTPLVTRPVRTHVPDRDAMVRLWATCRQARERPAPLVTLVVGMHVLAAHRLGRAPDDWARVPTSAANLRRFVGARRGSTFTARLRALESLELVMWAPGLVVAPASTWGGMRRGLGR